MNEICRRSGVQKPTLKQRFEDKNKIICEFNQFFVCILTFRRLEDLPSEIESKLVKLCGDSKLVKFVYGIKSSWLYSDCFDKDELLK